MNQRLYKSRTDVVWTGVAGGVAEWLRLDPSLVRIAWVILTPFTGGLALLVYLVMWIVVPVAPRDLPAVAATARGAESGEGAAASADAGSRAAAGSGTGSDTGSGLGSGSGSVPDATSAPAQPSPVVRREPGNAGVVVGIGLIVAGGLFLVRELVPAFDWSYVWPIALILLGAALLVGVGRREA